MAAKSRQELLDVDAGMNLVEDRNVDFGIGTEHGAPRGIAPETIENGKRVRRDEGAQPLNDVAIVVIMRRLDQNQLESPIPDRGTYHTTRSPHMNPKYMPV